MPFPAGGVRRLHPPDADGINIFFSFVAAL